MSGNYTFTSMKTIIRLASLLLLCVCTLNACDQSEKKETTENVITLNSNNFDNEIRSGVILVDFWAGWCRPCKAMAPVLEEVAITMKGKARIGKVDVDVNEDLAQRFGIQAIPCFILFKEGNKVESLVGIQSKEAILEMIKRNLPE